MSPRPDDPGSESRAEHDDTTRELPTDHLETNAMTTDPRDESPRGVPVPSADPLADPLADPTAGRADPTAAPVADPVVTTEIPASSTQALPSNRPFRVEPSAPVPDDVVAPGSELPHLPPAPAPAHAPQPAAVPQPAPRPALVTVNKGPRPATVMLGLLSVLVATYLLLANLTRVDLGFAVSGPFFLGAFGGILLLVGLAGVVAGRLRRR